MNVHSFELIEHGDAPPSALRQEFPVCGNTPDDVIFEHITGALQRGLPIIHPARPHNWTAAIVGGGPSAKDTLSELGNLARPNVIFALNGAGLWLQSVGIVPHALIILDARPSNARFIK